MLPRPTTAVAMVLGFALAGCGADTSTDASSAGATASASAKTGGAGASPGATDTAEQRYPDIVDAEVRPAGDGRFDIEVTVSSPYDTPERYADGWRVLAPDGTELGTHTLLHDHAGEQPFSRTQSGVEIPTDVTEVTIEGRDQQYGFGGETVTVAVPHGQG
ncbi:MAG: hypothetical protein KY460_15755 [Actinobacteria bacterium]|nr:hypothetical protein [Actinomycetota bacterium]